MVISQRQWPSNRFPRLWKRYGLSVPMPQSWGHCNKPTDADTDTRALRPPTTALFTANVASFLQPLSGMRPTVLCGRTRTVLYYVRHMTERWEGKEASCQACPRTCLNVKRGSSPKIEMWPFFSWLTWLPFSRIPWWFCLKHNVNVSVLNQTGLVTQSVFLNSQACIV